MKLIMFSSFITKKLGSLGKLPRAVERGLQALGLKP
jgi:hypothetical protein